MVKTIDQMIEVVEGRIEEYEKAQALAEADGTSDYDYYEGLLDAYGVTLAMLNQIVKEQGK